MCGVKSHTHKATQSHTSHLDRGSRAGGERGNGWADGSRGGGWWEGSVPCWGFNRSGQEGGGVGGVREENLRQKGIRDLPNYL